MNVIWKGPLTGSDGKELLYAGDGDLFLDEESQNLAQLST